jgi:anaerobic selenocysteine-containing dehydrogenase
LEREDVFWVVQDTHWSETAAFADVVLPAATYLEKTDINFSDHHLYSQFTDVYGPIPQIVWINPKDASKIGILDGEIVAIFNELGAVTLKAEITDKVSMGTLWAPRPLIGLNGFPLNTLAPGTSQEIGGGQVFIANCRNMFRLIYR